MENIYSYFLNLKEENKMSHSFLIGNVLFDDIKEELNKTIKEIFMNNDINIEENPDVYILRNNEKDISKDDIKELIGNLNRTSQFNNIKIYIIENCEKLNDFACNALLKTLEEPPENVYALLLSSNINDVKDTISSRCQKVFVSSSINYCQNKENIEDISNTLIEYIEKNGINTISKNYDIYSIIEDRKMFIDILKSMLYKYKNELDNSLKNNKNGIISKNNTIEEISRKIVVINENINRLDIPLNKNLIIDRFIIEMWRCKDENC